VGWWVGHLDGLPANRDWFSQNVIFRPLPPGTKAGLDEFASVRAMLQVAIVTEVQRIYPFSLNY
jgi:hypothetical protein